MTHGDVHGSQHLTQGTCPGPRPKDGTVYDVAGVRSGTKAADPGPREREARFQAIFQQVGVGMAEISLCGRWLDVNDRLCDMLGTTREELRGTDTRDVTHPADLPAEQAHLLRLLAGEIASFTMEKRYIRKNGSHLWTTLTLSPVRDQTATPQCIFGVI